MKENFEEMRIRHNKEIEVLQNSCKLCSDKGLEEYSSSGLFIGVEYGYTEPEMYDGISEWRCINCGRRYGRWAGKLLKEGEIEKRFGGE